MLTNSELVLGAAGIGVLGTLLGGVVSWLTGTSAARRQWQREERRRQADRRSALYEEMLAEVETRSLDQAAVRAKGIVGEPAYQENGEAAAREARFNARVVLVASYEVNTLWHEWVEAFSASWASMEDGEQHAAAKALATRMRIELDSQ